LYILIDEKIKIILLILEGYMKNFNTIILLLSLVGTISGMKEVSVIKNSILFVELNKENVKPINLYVGDNIRYYKEYEAQQKGDNTRLKCPYYLPIEHCGSLRFFVSSVIGGAKENPGAAYVISNSAIMQIGVVRCFDKMNNNTANIYLGIGDDNVESEGLNKIYSAHIMLIQTKQKDSSARELYCYKNYPMYNYVKKFNRSELLSEVRKHVAFELSVENPIFQKKAKKLLGERAKNFDFEGGFFVFLDDYMVEIMAVSKKLK
jgi:hypothetical protein